MSLAGATRCSSEGCPWWFFDDSDKLDDYYKIYNDGGHFVATRVFHSQLKPKTAGKPREDIDILFDSLYQYASSNGLRDTKHDTAMTDYIRNGIRLLFPRLPHIDDYIAKKIKSKLNNLLHRKKRFRRKAYLNEWNYFVTFTYDDAKHDEQTFRKKLRKCLSNLHTRRGWKYMGVFENAPDTGRLHFHGLFYVPDGEMIGKITEHKDYSTAQHQMQITHRNDFFDENFGRNDFEELDKMALKYGHTLDYILKYIGKTNERIVYSRGIPTEVVKKLTKRDIVTEFQDYVTKYVLFDNVVDHERDVLKLRRHKQLSIFDWLCNPPRVA